MKTSTYRLWAVFLISIALISFEIAVMRSFAIGSWSNFGSMVISIALLGFGLAGSLLTFLRDKVKKNADNWLFWSALGLLPSMAVSHILAPYVPFNPIFIISETFFQILCIGAFYLIYSIPFFIGALFIGVAFIVLTDQIHKLYFWNMLGSGLGGFFILGLMFFIPPDYLLIPLLVLIMAGILICFKLLTKDNKKKQNIYIALSSAVFVLVIACIIFGGEIRVSEYKPISYAQKYLDSRLVHHSYGPTGEIDVYNSSYFHIAPGLSDNTALNLKSMPEKAFLGLFIDGEGPIGIMRNLKKEQKQYMDYLPITAPFLLFHNPRVLIIKIGGGTSIFTALYHKAQEVQVVESNPALISLLQDDPYIKEFNNNLLKDSRVKINSGEARAFCAATNERFDIVEIGLIDSIGLSRTGGYPVKENYIYTAEAIKDYLSCLNDNGILSITVWNKLDPPRNVPKLISTIAQALGNQAESRIYMFSLILSTTTILIKKTAFTPQEIKILNRFCRKMSFDACYYPGMREGESRKENSLAAMLAAYKNNFFPEADYEPGTTQKILNSGDFYHYSFLAILYGKQDFLYNNYIFDVTPVTDARPYYTGYMKPQNTIAFLDKINTISEEWGYLLLLGTLIQSLLFGLLIILIPIIGRRHTLFKGRKGTLGVIIYYSCLGLGYMMIEIFLIQKLVFFLAEPIFSVTIVLTTMLVASGSGSLYASRFPANCTKYVRIAVTCIGISLLFFIFGLSPLLKLLLGLPLLLKMFISCLVIIPPAFFLGMPFPSGLSSLGENSPQLLPWAWGMNGALSVTGTMLARLFSISWGFNLVLVIALVLYAIAGIIFPVNQRKEAKV